MEKTPAPRKSATVSWQSSLSCLRQRQEHWPDPTWASASRSFPWNHALVVWSAVRRETKYKADKDREFASRQLCCAYARDHWISALSMLATMKAERAVPDLVSHNIVSSAVRQHGQWRWVSLLVNGVCMFSLSPDAATCCVAITAAQSGQWWQAAAESFSMFSRQALVPNVILYNALISVSSKSSSWQHSFAVSKAMQEGRIVRDVVGHNSVIYAADAGKRWQAALHVFSTPPDGILPNTVSNGTCVTACQRARCWQMAFHRAQDFAISPVVQNAALAASVQGRAWRQTSRLLQASHDENLQLGLVTLNTILSGSSSTANWLQSLLVFHEVTAARVQPDSISYGSVAGVTAGGDWELSLQLLTWMAARCEAFSVVSLSEVARACGKKGAWNAAYHTLAMLSGAHVRPNVITRNVVLNALETRNLWIEALDLATTSCSKAVQTSEVSFGSLLGACGNNPGRWRIAPLLLARAIVAASASSIVFNIAISRLGEVKKWPNGVSLLEKMLERSLETDSSTWTCLVSSCDQWAAAFTFIGPRSEVRVPALNAAISVAGGDGRWQRALPLFLQCRAWSLQQTSVTINAAVDAIARGANWELTCCFLSRAASLAVEVSDSAFSMAINGCEKAVLQLAGGGTVHFAFVRKAVPFLSLNGARHVRTYTPCLNAVHEAIFGENMRDAVGPYCCAQFVVQDKQIRERPLEFYQRMLRLVDGTMAHDLCYPGKVKRSTHCYGMEFTWHLVFGEDYDPPLRQENTFFRTSVWRANAAGMSQKVVVASGYFDPLHYGHIEYLQRSRDLGDKLIVIVNNDTQAKDKKGQPFMPARERVKLVRSLACVDAAIEAIDQDQTVRRTLRLLHPDIFTNGGDIKNEDVPEADVCRELGIKLIDGLGDKVQSSSWLINKIAKPAVNGTSSGYASPDSPES
eukprot:s3726_g3.t1